MSLFLPDGEEEEMQENSSSLLAATSRKPGHGTQLYVVRTINNNSTEQVSICVTLNAFTEVAAAPYWKTLSVA